MSSKRVKKNEVEPDGKGAGVGADNYDDGGSAATHIVETSIRISEEDRKLLAAELMPKIEQYIDKKFKELEPQKENMVPSGQTSGVPASLASNPQNAGAPDLNNILKQVQGMIAQPASSSPGGEGEVSGQPNPLAALMGGAAGGNPAQMMLLQLIFKELGLGGQQQNPMGAMMPELMMRAFMEDIAFGTALKKAAITTLFKNPEIAAQFNTASDAFVGQPLGTAAKLMTGNNGGQK